MIGDPDPWSPESFKRRIEDGNNPDELADAGIQQGMHRSNLQTGAWEEEQTNCSQFGYEYIVGLEMAVWEELQLSPVAIKLCEDNRKAFDLILRWSYTSQIPDPEKIKAGFKQTFQQLLASQDGPIIGQAVEVSEESQGLLIKAIIQPAG